MRACKRAGRRSAVPAFDNRLNQTLQSMRRRRLCGLLGDWQGVWLLPLCVR